MLLKSKNAIIYGAGGSIGGVVARAFAGEGANLFLAGRTRGPLEIVANEIISAGGRAEVMIVDALNEESVNKNMNALIEKEGSIDISFNAINVEDKQGISLAEMQLDDFFKPISIAMRSQFITTKAASKHMLRNGSGVILSITATPAAKAYALTGGFGPTCSAIEGFSRNLAAELGPKGIRVVCIRSAGSPDSVVFQKMLAKERQLAKDNIDDIAKDTMLKRLPSLKEIANVAAFLVSDKASGMTGTSANVTCGTTID